MRSKNCPFPGGFTIKRKYIWNERHNKQTENNNCDGSPIHFSHNLINLWVQTAEIMCLLFSSPTGPTSAIFAQSRSQLPRVAMSSGFSSTRVRLILLFNTMPLSIIEFCDVYFVVAVIIFTKKLVRRNLATTMAVKSRCPAATAEPIATLSAH